MAFHRKLYAKMLTS